MKYSEVIEYLKEHGIYKNPDTKEYYVYGDDVPERPERTMIDQIGEPVFMTHFPAPLKSFYMDRDPANEGETLSADLLYPGVGEIIGGSMRLWDLDKLMKGFEINKIDPKPYEFYIDQRRYGSCPHGGFGLGIERLVMCVCNLESVKSACLFPRFIGRCTP
jgi:asparaginyl-tRNA synthetase